MLLQRPIALLFFVLTAFSIWRFSKAKPAILQEPG